MGMGSRRLNIGLSAGHDRPVRGTIHVLRGGARTRGAGPHCPRLHESSDCGAVGNQPQNGAQSHLLDLQQAASDQSSGGHPARKRCRYELASKEKSFQCISSSCFLFKPWVNRATDYYKERPNIFSQCCLLTWLFISSNASIAGNKLCFTNPCLQR